MYLKPMRVGMAAGGFFAVVHIVWAALVAIGWAQGFMDFVFTAHMIRPVYTVLPFNFASSVTLIIVVTVVGYVAGFVFAHVWNKVGHD